MCNQKNKKPEAQIFSLRIQNIECALKAVFYQRAHLQIRNTADLGWVFDIGLGTTVSAVGILLPQVVSICRAAHN